MRKHLFAAALGASALTLSACSGGGEDATKTADQGAPADAGAETPATAAAVLNPNSATAEQLASVEGITPELATAIIAGKPYADASALNKKLLETLKVEEASKVLAGVFVPVNLNSGSEADIKLIPGMTDKMVHEFLEYRPYADMGVFDREIGKYVDAAEVARLRTYVTL
jgi:DNA uptake protein ComE-like DNA-binding protein